MNHGTAPGKIILFGEHSVVYGQPALAVPVGVVQAHASVTPLANEFHRMRLTARDVGIDAWMDELNDSHPLALIIRLALEALAISGNGLHVELRSSIPIAAGMGSGAATSIAILRALAAYAGKTLPAERQSELAFEVEKIYHGTPSGIDNTVIAFNQPVWYIQGETPQPFTVSGELDLVIADTGIHTATSQAVGHVRQRWEKDPAGIAILFEQMGQIAHAARTSLERGDLASLGSLMNENQSLLAVLGVSSRELNTLLHVCHEAGAFGAKLSGAGMGGNIIALTHPEPIELIQSLKLAGAEHVYHTRISS